MNKLLATIMWNKTMDPTISQLKSSAAGGPKKLKVVTVWGGDRFGPELVIEEVVV